MQIERPWHRQRVRQLLARSPVVAILGARQVGKTTLAADLLRSWPAAGVSFDLEDPAELARLATRH